LEPAGKLGHSIQCHYHAWTYALDGRLIGAPHMNEDPTFDRSLYALLPVNLVEWEGFVMVNLAQEPVPFEQAFAPLIDKFARWLLPELRVGDRIEYEVAANWKLLFENYNECYHCPLVHPALASRSPYRSGQNDLMTGPFLGGPMQLQEELGSLTLSGNSCAPLLGELEGADCHQVYYYSIFPNLLLSLHPDYVMAHTIWPVGTAQTRVTCEWLFAPEAFDLPGFNPRDAIDFWDVTNRQDWHVCETTQQGVSSRAYRPGPFSPLENIPAAFDEEYLRALGEPAD
jgi:Rieske 2Fe-2S family protein